MNQAQLPNPKKMSEDGIHPSPGIPSKRAKVTQDQTAPSELHPGPPVFTRKLRKAAVGTGCDIRLRVSVEGQPCPSLCWYHNEELLPPSGDQDSGGLWIRDCRPSDAGLYTCVATNALGETRSSAVLAVMDLGEDSENTEDEATEPQVPMESKDGPGRLQDKAGRRVPAGEGGRMMEMGPDGAERRATLPGGQDPVVERELLALGSRPPGPQDPTAHRIKPADVSRVLPSYGSPSPTSPQTSPSSFPASPLSSQLLSHPTTQKNGVTTHSTQDRDLGGAVAKTEHSGVTSQGSDSRSQNTNPKAPEKDTAPGGSSGGMTPKVARAGSKIFDKVRAFEERIELPGGGGSVSGRSWAGFGRMASCDSDNSGQQMRGCKEERQGAQPGAGQRRSAFKQRASSLEDKPSYTQRVQNKFTEELQRIKKLVGRPNLKKAYSTEQLPQRERLSVGKLEPIPPQVVKKLEERERVLVERGEGGSAGERVSQKSSSSSQEKGLSDQKEVAHKEQASAQKSESKRVPADSATLQVMGKTYVAMETAAVNQLPGRRSPGVTRRSLARETLQSSQSPKPPLTAEEQPPSPSRDLEQPPPKMDCRSQSPTAQREPPLHAKEPEVQYPAKPPRLIPSPTPSISPLIKRRKGELGRTSPALKLTIPTIVVEDEPMEEEEAGEKRDVKRSRGGKKEGRSHKSKRGHARQPMSPEQGNSSDDSYMSAEEGPAEAPEFERPLRDTSTPTGSEVILRCIITGNPLPTVTWKKSNTEIRSSLSHVVKAEGEMHSLVIKQMRPGDAGTYCVTAVNTAGKASCYGTLYIKSESTQVQGGKPSLPLEVRSPIQSDEEYVSPLEEVMEFEDLPSQGAQNKHGHFKEAPTFKVGLCDQGVTEGQEVIMSVKTKGEPKPMVYWLRDTVTLKTAGRFVVSETEDTNEMRITSAQRSDAGVYACKIINEYGTKQSECCLEVKVPPAQSALVISRQVRDVAVRAGESAMFECHMTGPQDVEVDWLSNGKLIQPALLNCKMHFDGKRCRLLLNSVHEDDSGTYTCKLSTAKEELTSSAILKVTPSREPLFTRKLDILEVIEGRTARFDCKVSGSPPPEVTWTHFETLVEDNENVRILKEGGRHSLVIAHVSSETEGFYTAVALNAHGKAESTAELYMQEPRLAVSSHMAKLEKMPSIAEEPEVLESEEERRTMPDYVKPLCDLEVIEGKEAVLKCKVAGLPYPTIAWYHNGKRIDSSEERKMTQYRDVHSLVIRCVCHAHGGVYKSVISNKVGKAACYAHLYITDIVPDPPEGPPVVEAITGKTITLSWKRPKRLDPSIDGSSLTYAVQQQALGSIQWTIIASNLRETSYTIISLSKGVRYAFRVLTATSKALSKPSPSTDLMQLMDRGPYLRKAPIILDKPDIVYVVENQSVNITLTLNHVHATVIWKRRGVVLVNRPGMFEMSMPDDDQHNLKIQRVRSTDAGQLVCMANNQFGSDLCTLQLAIAVPPKFESIMEDVDVHVGETSRFAVVVEGKPDPNILWYKDDILLSESNHFTFVYDDSECSLVVLNARPEDSGVYTCTAKNLAGSVSCKAELTVRTVRKEAVEPMEDEGTILRKMRRLTDYYDVHKEIARGAFSYVKRVTLKKGKAEFAAKFISARGKRKASALKEMGLLSDLDHERILYFHDAFEKKNVVIIITELYHEELLERLTKKTTLMESQIRSGIGQVLEGLNYLHQRDIAHLDIKPENILMADHSTDQIRICDFGNAVKLETTEAHYCKYGTPEFVAPEIVNQSPVSKATDIWPVGVITYLCLTGVSPFAGENDRSTVLNIRNYNVAFEESMFADLCREAKGFVIKLLVADRLRPSTAECLRHPWFKTSNKDKSINTAMLKQVLSRRKWQRSLISYKSKMVMRSIPELLNDSSSHISIAVARHLKEGSPPPSSSSDSDEDVDELPFVPMPLSMVFSGSRISLNELPGDEDTTGRSNGTVEGVGLTRHKEEPMNTEVAKKEGMEVEGGTGGTRKRTTMEEDIVSSDEEKITVMTKRVPLKKGSSVEMEDSQTKLRRGMMRRGSSADSALLLQIEPEEGAVLVNAGEGNKTLKKAVSMELPNRSPSPGVTKMCQEDYALKLELMRQRLLRGGNMDKKMSGLRGPLLETLGMDDERRTSSLDRNLRRSRVGPPLLTRAASSESPGEDMPKTKVFRKSASCDDSEPMSLHRRFGAPLEIPTTRQSGVEGKRLQEATSMSALTEQTKLESCPASPWGGSPTVQPSPVREDQQQDQQVREVEEPEKLESMSEEISERDVSMKRSTKLQEKGDRLESKRGRSKSRSPSVQAPIIVIEEDDEKEEQREKQEIKMDKGVKANDDSPGVTPKDGKKSSAYANTMQTIIVPSGKSNSNQSQTKPTDSPTLPEHPAVFAKVATIDRPINESSSATIPERPTTPRQPTLRTDIKNIESEELFEARFKKRESSLTRGLRKLTRTKSEEKSPVLPRKADEEVYRPGPMGAPLEMVSKGLQEKSKSVQDLREVEKETGLGLIGRFSMRAKRASSIDKKEEKVKEEKPKEETSESSAGKRRVSWGKGHSKSLDKRELETAETQRQLEERECRKIEESSVFAMRRKFESKVAGISAKIRTQSEERKEEKDAKSRLEEVSRKDQEEKDCKKVNESPVLAMRRRFENKVAGISSKIRSQSEERTGETEVKVEGKKTPLFSRHRHSHSEGGGLKGMGIPENQLAKQTSSGASKESLESTSSINSEKVSHTPEGDRRSRWDRWGLTRNRKDKTPSQTDIPSAVPTEKESSGSQQYSRSSSDFPPVFHIKLKDHVLLEGDPVTLSCLPAGSPHPQVAWMKDKRPLEVDDRMNLISHPDGRQLLTIMKTSRRDAGLYECVATNPLATITSSCTLSLACVPKRPGTPEVPQTYNNTALVLWKPADTKAPCSYILERKTDGDAHWLIIATGVADCYYNVTDLPTGGTFRFRVSCVNKAGQGPCSNWSDQVRLDSTVGVSSPAVAIVKTIPAPPTPIVTSSMTVPELKPVQTHPPSETVSTMSPSSLTPSLSQTPLTSPAPFPAPTTSLSPSMAATTLFSTPSSPTAKTPPSTPLTVTPTMKETPNIIPPALPSPPVVKPRPSFVLPKPQSPVNVVPPMTQTPSTSPPPPLVTPPPTPTKPVMASVPTYVPAATARVVPTTLPAPSFSPHVLQVASLSPIGEGDGIPMRGTPTGRTTPKPGETTLRQGIPQKPYTFLDEKARGQYGVLRECRENATGNLYMAKIVPYDQENKPSVLQEYEILKSLHNDKIMGLHEAYVTPRYLVLVAEYCTGKELLYSLIDRFRYSEDDVVGYLVQILQGIEFLHNRRVLHLDIKPDNIMLTNLNVIKIVDFGSAQHFNPLSLKHYSSGLGTLEYMAPEMVKGDVVGPPADIWSLGVLVYIMLSGKFPFQEKDPLQTESKIQMAKFDPTKLYPNVSQSASSFLKKLLSSYAWARPTTKDCFTHAWLQDSYLMKLRRQTLTFPTTRLKEFLVDNHRHRTEASTKHKVLLRSYQSSPQTPPR